MRGDNTYFIGAGIFNVEPLSHIAKFIYEQLLRRF